MFDVADSEGKEPRVEMHAAMPNVPVACPHAPQSMSRSSQMPPLLCAGSDRVCQREQCRLRSAAALVLVLQPDGQCLGDFENHGVVHDCMDELSQFIGTPKRPTAHGARLMEQTDIVFTGGYELGDKKSTQHSNVHVFGCGVEMIT